jgi:hypothetical protein
VTCSWPQGQFIQEMMQEITAADTGQQSNIAKLIIVSDCTLMMKMQTNATLYKKNLPM